MTGGSRAYGGRIMGRLSDFGAWRWHTETIVAVSILATMFAIVNIAQAQAGSSAVGQHMEGAWRATINGEGRPVELAFYHFTADGAVLVVGSPRTQSVAVGAWVRTGNRQFGLTQHRFNY